MPRKKQRTRHCGVCGGFLSAEGTCRKCYYQYVNNETNTNNEVVIEVGDEGESMVEENIEPMDIVTVNEESTVAMEEASVPEDVELVQNMNKNKCTNCFRWDVDFEGNHIDGISIQFRNPTGIRYRLKLCSVENVVLDELMLCEECYEMLTNTGTYYSWKSCWPAFLWKMFSCVDNYGFAEDMWSCIPKTLRAMWLESYLLISENHRVVTNLEPSTYFYDITKYGNEIDRLKGRNTMIDLKKYGNLSCYCPVRCPWGCTEYSDECGYIPYLSLIHI